MTPDAATAIASLPDHKTKIIATIGPASDAPGVLEALMRAGMDVARLNFSHGEFASHGERIVRIRAAARATGRQVVIMADLPGPKMRLGTIDPEPIVVRAGAAFTLTTDDVPGNAERVAMSFPRLPEVVRDGDRLFLNDGLVELQVEGVVGPDVQCRVIVGGELRSRKGLNLPGIDLGIGAFTEHDRACLAFALAQGVDAISQSFVETAADIVAVRAAAAALGATPFVIAKIERAGALSHLDEILRAADGIMVARGDLGVEVPIETIALTQKQLIALANAAGKPVITATQMLESMIVSRLPTRAEATDVANAILDGTDALMLSGESAVGAHPVDAVAMLARIAAVTEPHRASMRGNASRSAGDASPPGATIEAFASVVEHALDAVACEAVMVPTRTGKTARMIARIKPEVWVVAVSADPVVCRGLVFSYGVYPWEHARDVADWRAMGARWLGEHGLPAGMVLLVAGPSRLEPSANHRIEFLRVGGTP